MTDRRLSRLYIPSRPLPRGHPSPSWRGCGRGLGARRRAASAASCRSRRFPALLHLSSSMRLSHAERVLEARPRRRWPKFGMVALVVHDTEPAVSSFFACMRRRRTTTRRPTTPQRQGARRRWRRARLAEAAEEAFFASRAGEHQRLKDVAPRHCTCRMRRRHDRGAARPELRPDGRPWPTTLPCNAKGCPRFSTASRRRRRARRRRRRARSTSKSRTSAARSARERLRRRGESSSTTRGPRRWRGTRPSPTPRARATTTSRGRRATSAGRGGTRRYRGLGHQADPERGEVDEPAGRPCRAGAMN